MWVLGSSLGHEAWLQYISVHWALCWLCYCLLYHRHLFFKLFQLHTLNLKSDFLSLQSVTPRSQLAPFLFPLHWRIQPQWLLFWTLFCFISQIPRHLAACDFFLWCCEKSHDICKEYVCFLKARILSEALEDTLLLKGWGGQGRVTGMLPPEPALPFQALH